MSDYQFLIGVGDGITSELTLSKFASNQCAVVPSSIKFKVGVYTQDSQSTEWSKVDERIFGRSTFLSFAKVPHNWAFMHDRVAYNYRLPNINAALGCAQLEQLPDFLTRKRLLAEKYNQVFCGVEGVVCFNEPNYARSNYWMNVLLFDRECVDDLEIVLKQTNDQDIMTRPTWNLMHSLPMFSNSPRMNLSMAESLRQRVINLPSSPALFREPNQKPSRADDGERNG